MARVTKDVTIGKSNYKLMTCGAQEGAKGATRLMKILARTFDGGGPNASIADAFSQEDMDFFIDLMGRHSMVDGRMVNEAFDEHFAGNYLEMLEWLVAALRHNYARFLDDPAVTSRLKGLLQKVMDLGGMQFPGLKESITSSTDS